MLCSCKHISKQLKMWLFYFIWWKPSVDVPITTVPICFYYVVHLRKIPAELATSVMCGWLAGCFSEHTCIPDILSEIPCIRQRVEIIPGLDPCLSCFFFHAVVDSRASWCCSFHTKDLVHKALFWALLRHILNRSCHDMTATVHFIVSPPYCLFPGAHHWHLEEEMGIAVASTAAWA